MDEAKAVGPDGISSRILKRCADAIAPYLFVTYNKSLNDGSLPDDWRVAHVVPVHKKGPKRITNYRPISLTYICCKLLEHVLYCHIIKHLNCHNSFLTRNSGSERRTHVLHN